MASYFPLKYPEDLYGTSSTNLVVGEHHTLLEGTLNRLIKPIYAPFFSASMRIVDDATGAAIPDEAWVALDLNSELATRTGRELCWLIAIVDESVSSNVTIQYQTVGGKYVVPTDFILAYIAALDLDNRAVDWNNLTGIPAFFPPTEHLHDLGDMYGFEYFTEPLYAIRDAILVGDAAAHAEIYTYIDAQIALISAGSGDVDTVLTAHVNNTNNPHATTKAHVGLGLVQNYPVATDEEALAGTANDRYMTPHTSTLLINALAGTAIQNHLSAANPHGITKTTIGLGAVENYAIASQAEAEQGTVNNRYMTPLMTKFAIIALTGGSITDHLQATNPHGITAALLGLGNVQNFVFSSQAEAEDGTRSDRYMSPLRTKQAITAQVGTAFANHLSATNPHGITAAIVGLGSVVNYGIATDTEAVQATVNNKYMTPYKTQLTVMALAGNTLNTHLSASNPHGITKTTVGLGLVQNYGIPTQSEAEDGTVGNLYMTPVRTKQAIAYQAASVINSYIKNSSNAPLVFGDNVRVSFGTGEDFRMWCSGGNMYMDMFSTGVERLYFRDGTNVRAYLERASGKFWASDFGLISDVRLKTNIEVIKDALAKIRKLSGVVFDRLDIKGLRQAGTLAHQVLEVLPEAVTHDDETGYNMVSYWSLTALFIEAFHEVSDFMQRVNTRLAELAEYTEARLDAVDARLQAVEAALSKTSK